MRNENKSLFTGKTIVIGIILIALGFTGCSSENKEQNKAVQQRQALPVSVFTIVDKKVKTTEEYPSIIKPFEEVNVTARVKGMLVKKYFNEGNFVKKGTLLYTIEQDTYLANLNQAQANYNKANKDYSRANALLKTKSISNQQYDEYKFMYEDAKAKFQQAQIEFNHTKVVAPIDGIVGIKHSDIGDLVGTNETNSLLVTITNTNPVHAEFSLSQEDVKNYMKQIRAKVITIDLVSGSQVYKKGIIDYISPQIDSSTNTLMLRAKFDNTNQEILIGEFAKVRLNNLDLGKVYVIPETALLKTSKGTFVYVIASNQATLRLIKTRALIKEGVVVYEGLQVSDQVIISNIAKLRPNTPVQIINIEKK